MTELEDNTVDTVTTETIDPVTEHEGVDTPGYNYDIILIGSQSNAIE